MKFSYYLNSLILIFFIISCQENPGSFATSSNINLCDNKMSLKSIIGYIDWIEYNQTGDYAQNSNELAVAQIKIPSMLASCTGFLINEDTIMTNNHCISSPSKSPNVEAIFRSENGDRTSFVCDQFITTNFQYDFTLIKCNNSPGKEFGWVGLSHLKPEIDSQIYLVQENCDYISDPHCVIDKFVAFGKILGSQQTRIYHNADTLAGSSGSPIFSEESHQVIAIHNAGSITSDENSAKNGGVPMYKIRNLIETTTDVIIHEFGTAGEFPIGQIETLPENEPHEDINDSTGDSNMNDNCSL